ncbi:uncharacterized protein LOC121737378 [Aricia agestis]|uniref:uncharacterized protein LOC121737378 n=1 Tax=Aricia agestis TaxID=91739 RepID=UPI001C208711|nr:uncharacterized protein LOC121737378 [Aricia agestis]XP_041984984.1 uncharacterized protein LOC121737378 [Aricia agestis]
MDNSQFSTTFSEVDCVIDTLCYEEFISELKDCFNLVSEDVSEHLTKILKDCEECLTQTFDIIIDLKEKLTDEKKLGAMLENAITILKMLARHLKNLEKCSFTSCNTNKTFPTMTGNIIYTVFNHCKNSEQLYGIYLRSLENELKDLFRSCHELQLTYLMILEKYYVIDLDVEDEQAVLLASLEINLNICDIAQALDVKTMAEHWKAYTAICEKHAQYLQTTDIFNKCAKNVVATVKNNMNFEQMEDDKVIVRSLKVTAFVIKILFKLAGIFKNLSYKNEHILELILFVYQYKDEVFDAKAAEHSNLIEGLIMSTVDNLVKEILSEEFLDYVYTLPVHSKNVLYILLLTNIMRQIIQNTHQIIENKERLIEQVFLLLPKCQSLFTNPTRLKLNNKFYELYQYLVIHTVAFATSFSQEQYTKLEQILFQTLLSIDYNSATFASDLWVILCRNNTQLQLNTLSGLIRNYQKLETNKMFQILPQKQYILHTIEKMFKNLPYDEKILIYRQCNIQDRRNSSVWTVMMVHLPDNIRVTAENIVTDRCLTSLQDFLKLKSMGVGDLNVAIQNIQLLANCTTNHRDLKDIEAVLVNCWLKCCPSAAIQNCLNNNIVFFKYIEALASCTCKFIDHFEGISIEKTMHVVFKLIEVKNIQVTLILFELCCELLMAISTFCFVEEFSDDLNDLFLRANKDTLRRFFIIAVSKPTLKKFVTEHLKKDSILKEVCEDFEAFKNTLDNNTGKSDFSFEYAFKHICDDESAENVYFQKGETNDEVDIMEEPVPKKAKTDSSVIEEAVSSLEDKVSRLVQEKETLTEDHKRRLRNICHKLKTMI